MMKEINKDAIEKLTPAQLDKVLKILEKIK
jgi:hypothetical protein